MAVLATDLFEEATTVPAPLPTEWSYPTGLEDSLSMHWAYLSNIPGGGSAEQRGNEAVIHQSVHTQIGAAYRNDINPGPNQYASAQIDLHGGGAVAVRMSPTNGNCYYLFLTYGRLDLILFKYFEGNLTQLSSIYADFYSNA